MGTGRNSCRTAQNTPLHSLSLKTAVAVEFESRNFERANFSHQLHRQHMRVHQKALFFIAQVLESNMKCNKKCGVVNYLTIVSVSVCGLRGRRPSEKIDIRIYNYGENEGEAQRDVTERFDTRGAASTSSEQSQTHICNTTTQQQHNEHRVIIARPKAERFFATFS